MQVQYRDIIEKAFNNFNGKNPSVLNDFYDEAVTFQDPLTRVQGLEALKAYYAHAYKNVLSIRFIFGHTITEDSIVGVPWEMQLSARSLNNGKEISVFGFSQFRFNSQNKVCYHRDYFDLGAMVYENIPIQGAVIRLLKKLLQP